MLAAVTGHELEARINAELMQSVLEITTPVCHNAGDVMRWLTKLRGYVTEIAHEQERASAPPARIRSASSSASGSPRRIATSALIDQLQYVARRELIFGMHVHVAVDEPGEGDPGRQRAAPASRPAPRAVGELAVLARRADGLASSRQMVFSAFPRSGPPPRFRDYADYASVVGQLERSGCIADYTHIWWDIRLHPRLGTIEIRICDAVTRVEDAVAIAAYCQALVKQLCERHEAGEEIPSYHRILTSENKWLAARYGLEAPVMDLATGEQEPRAGRAARPPHRRGAARRTRASSGPSASSRASSRSSAAARRRIASCASTTRAATSSRSRARSRTRPRRFPSPSSSPRTSGD